VFRYWGEEEVSWKNILKAPPFDAVRYEKRVSTPRQMTFPSFFSQVLDRYIENEIKSRRIRNPSKSEKRKYTVRFRGDDVERYQKYLDKMVGEPIPTGRKYRTGSGPKGQRMADDYTRNFTDKIKQKMLREYNMNSIRLIDYNYFTRRFIFEFTLTDSSEPVKEEEKMVGAITTATPNITRVSYSQRRQKRGKEDEEE